MTYDNGEAIGYAFFVKDRILCFPSHYVNVFRHYREKVDNKDEFAINYESLTGSSSFSLTVDYILEGSICHDSSDFATIEVPTTIAKRPNIVHFFLTEK